MSRSRHRRLTEKKLHGIKIALEYVRHNGGIDGKYDFEACMEALSWVEATIYHRREMNARPPGFGHPNSPTELTRRGIVPRAERKTSPQ